MKEREVWIDYLKAIACILVALGHFLQSMIKSNLIMTNGFFTYFEETIYLFHVPLFFICSGYIFQQYSYISSIKSWFYNAVYKLIVLGTPYFFFSIITWSLKMFFSGSVNDHPGALIDVLFLSPLSPYWFLYVLFFIFLITPIFKEKKHTLFALAITLLIYFLHNYYPTNSYILSKLATYEFYFILGMVFSKFNISKCKLLKHHGYTLGITLFTVFLLLSIHYYLSESSAFMNLLLCLLACVSLACICIYMDFNKVHFTFIDYISEYTMPIFLMHTIFAAGLRSVLFKLNITTPWIHIIFGLLISFIGPIISAMIASKIKYVDFFLYPNKYIRKL